MIRISVTVARNFDPKRTPGFLLLTALTIMTATQSVSVPTKACGSSTIRPASILKEKYNFEPPAKWLDHVQKSSVRFNTGGSGSFVSADGLVMTNHHVGLGALQKLSSKDKDYVKDGFHAKTLDEEFKAVDEELNVLMEIVDVTEQVKAAVKPGMTPTRGVRGPPRRHRQDRERNRRRRPACAATSSRSIRAASTISTASNATPTSGSSSPPSSRSPSSAAMPDNFAFPRYDLDVCFFRVYENGKPAKIEHYLKWSKDGAKDGELVFVSGHPGHTDRLNTVAELEYLRDIGYPVPPAAAQSPGSDPRPSTAARAKKQERKAKDMLFGVANSRKARDGGLAGLARSRHHGEEEGAGEELCAGRRQAIPT